MKISIAVTRQKIVVLIIAILFFSNSSPSFAQGFGIDASTPATKLDVNGDIALRISSFTAITGDNNNINIGASSFVRITGPTNTYTITGIAGGVNGKMVILYNATAENMDIIDLSTSTAANQIICSDNVTARVKKFGCALLIYSSTDSRWILVSVWKN